ncbi:MAG: DUF6318 family protein [Cellulomonadaceae bacterium]
MVAILVGFGVAGCTGGAERPPTTGAPITSVSPSEVDATPTESASPTVGAERPGPPPDRPVRPDGMDAEGEVAAEIAARYFLDLYGYAIQTGDLEDFEAMSSPECQFCRTVIEDTRALYEAGGWISGGEIAYGELYPPTEIPDPAVIDFVFEATERARVFVRTAASPEEKTEEVPGYSRLAMEFRSGEWMLLEITGEQP